MQVVGKAHYVINGWALSKINEGDQTILQTTELSLFSFNNVS